METRAHYVAVGAFVLAMVVLGFAAVLWLARGQLNTQFAYYHIYFRGPVSGLHDGASVEYNGVPVGHVSEVKIDPENVERIQVTAQLDKDTVIKEDSRASVESNILSGVSFIQIVGGTQEAAVLTAKPGERYPVIRSHRSRLASVAVRGPQLLEKLNDTADHLNELLDDKNRRAVADLLENLRTLSAGLVDREKELAGLIGNANGAALALSSLLGTVEKSYAGPDGLGARAGTALADFDHLAKNLNDTNRQLQGALGDVRPGLRNFSQQTLGDVGALVGESRQLISGLSRVTSQIERDPSRVLFGDRHEGYKPK